MRIGSTQAGRRWVFWRGDKQERTFEGAPIEQLKSLSEVRESDIRYRWRVDLDKSTGMISETTIESLCRTCFLNGQT